MNCVKCGKERYHLDHLQIFSGRRCEYQEPKTDKEVTLAYRNEIATGRMTSTDGVQCPYCGYIQTDDLNPDAIGYDEPDKGSKPNDYCYGCERKFHSWCEITVTYYSKSLEAEDE